MKKLVLIDEEVLVRLVEGKYVEGSLHRDADDQRGRDDALHEFP